jgi:L-rhamnose mutarotase
MKIAWLIVVVATINKLHTHFWPLIETARVNSGVTKTYELHSHFWPLIKTAWLNSGVGKYTNFIHASGPS